MKVKKKGSKKWIIIIVILVLAIFGAVSGGGKDAKPEDPGEAAAPAEQSDPGEQETEAEAPADESDAPETETETDEPAQTEEPEANADGISPEHKEFLDSYEAFMDEYCEFMKNYDESDATQFLEYASLMAKYSDFAEKAEAWDEEEMTDEELIYYVKVMNRVNEKLLEAGVAE